MTQDPYHQFRVHDTSKMKELSELCDRLERARQVVEDYEQQLEDAMDVVKALESREIPDLMRELDMTEVTFGNGRKVAVSVKYKGGIAKENRAAAFVVLREMDEAGMIKGEVRAKFGAGDEKAQKLYKQLQARGIDVAYDENVHHSTISSWANKRMKAGEVVPPELGLFPHTTVKITP